MLSPHKPFFLPNVSSIYNPVSVLIHPNTCLVQIMWSQTVVRWRKPKNSRELIKVGKNQTGCESITSTPTKKLRTTKKLVGFLFCQDEKNTARNLKQKSDTRRLQKEMKKNCRRQKFSRLTARNLKQKSETRRLQKTWKKIAADKNLVASCQAWLSRNLVESAER